VDSLRGMRRLPFQRPCASRTESKLVDRVGHMCILCALAVSEGSCAGAGAKTPGELVAVEAPPTRSACSSRLLPEGRCGRAYVRWARQARMMPACSDSWSERRPASP
jgi:hypothetical protein